MTDNTKDCCTRHKGACCVIAAIIDVVALAAGLVFGGMQVRDGLMALNSKDRKLLARGLAQQDVVADLALWPISYTETGNDLSALQSIMDEKGEIVINFLKRHGITENEIELQQVTVQDLLAQSYRQGNVDDARYILTQG